MPAMNQTARLPQQYQLCKNDQGIEALQQTHGLIRVESTPTHAAFQPGWPETLTTIILNITVLVWSMSRLTGTRRKVTRYIQSRRWVPQCFKSWFEGIMAWGDPGITMDFAVPVIINSIWLTSFVIAETKSSAAGWVSANLFATGGLLARSAIWATSEVIEIEKKTTWRWFARILALFGASIAVLTLVIVGQRFAAPSGGFGTIAYNITDAHGCEPYDTMFFLQQGARRPVFRAIQLAQTVFTFVIVMTVALGVALMDGSKSFGPENTRPRRAVQKYGFPAVIPSAIPWMIFAIFVQFVPDIFDVASLFISLPLIIYQAVIANQGIPVVISGNCMLVELDPRYGFWDSQIDIYWKALVQMVGQ